jgi:hypothetical protein
LKAAAQLGDILCVSAANSRVNIKIMQAQDVKQACRRMLTVVQRVAQNLCRLPHLP